MTHAERAELRALALLLESWPTHDVTAVGYSGPVVAVLDATAKNYGLYVHEAVTL